MRRIIVGNLLVLAFAIIATAEPKLDETSRANKTLQTGDPVGAFYVTKIAGAEEDGVENGQELCYRCRYGSRPMVMIFTRETGGHVPQLVQEIDEAVDSNQEAQLRGLVTLMGDDVAKVKEKASQIAKKFGVKNVPVVIAKETETGPPNYKINGSEVTVIVASESQVVSTHTFDADKIDIAAGHERSQADAALVAV